jgi:hypothetical protein
MQVDELVKALRYMEGMGYLGDDYGDEGLRGLGDDLERDPDGGINMASLGPPIVYTAKCASIQEGAFYVKCNQGLQPGPKRDDHVLVPLGITENGQVVGYELTLLHIQSLCIVHRGETSCIKFACGDMTPLEIAHTRCGVNEYREGPLASHDATLESDFPPDVVMIPSVLKAQTGRTYPYVVMLDKILCPVMKARDVFILVLTGSRHG